MHPRKLAALGLAFACSISPLLRAQDSVAASLPAQVGAIDKSLAQDVCFPVPNGKVCTHVFLAAREDQTNPWHLNFLEQHSGGGAGPYVEWMPNVITDIDLTQIDPAHIVVGGTAAKPWLRLATLKPGGMTQRPVASTCTAPCEAFNRQRSTLQLQFKTRTARDRAATSFRMLVKSALSEVQ